MFFRRFLNPIFYSFLFATLFFSCSDISERKASLVVNMPSSARAASLKERVAGYYVYLFRTDIPEAEQKEDQSEREENTKVAKPGESVFFDDLDEGEYLVGVEAFDKDEWIIGGGEAKAKVVAGETVNVSITLKGVEDDGEKSDEEEKPTGDSGGATEEEIVGIAYRVATWNGSSVQYSLKGKSDGILVESDSTSWDSSWYVVTNDVSIDERITVTGDVNLILCDGATLTAQKGITLSSGNSLTIYAQQAGTGALIAKEYEEYIEDERISGSGIGGVYTEGPNSSGDGAECSGGTLTVHGGNITANGGAESAGIGGSRDGSSTTGGTVIIYGGTVNAKGGSGEPGIGGRTGGGTLTVYDGTLTSTGGSYGSGIGGGFNGSGGTVEIYGGSITATGDSGGAGIGGGGSSGTSSGAGGSVRITGGTVVAKGGVGIGGGNGCSNHGNIVLGSGMNILAGASADSISATTADDYIASPTSYVKITSD